MRKMMAKVVQIIGTERLIAKLRAKAAAVKKDVEASAVTGYTASYGIYVHENLEAKHKPGKQAKFLEAPARRLSSDGTFTRVIKDAVLAGQTVAQGILKAALYLQRESMKLVPVDTGALRASAFTKLESETPVSNTYGVLAE